MSKTSLDKELVSSSSNNEAIALAKEHIQAAAIILNSQGAELARVSWMLEDTIIYIDQASEKAATGPVQKQDKFIAELEKLVNVGEN